ncbi:MAG TPA: hypothetical protein VGN57_23365 [Pirellulaceae bacterium]|jgi:hypothetical protein|nr:hypothetical protein [Pirellulaceae bacterium]
MSLSDEEIRRLAPLVNEEFWRQNDRILIAFLMALFVGAPAGFLLSMWVAMATGIDRSIPPLAGLAIFVAPVLGAICGFWFARRLPLVATVILVAVLAAYVQPTVDFLWTRPTSRRTQLTSAVDAAARPSESGTER